MVTSIDIGENGRLGNQLFQYAAVKALALENNYDCVLPDLSKKTWHGQDCLLSNFNLECSFSDNINYSSNYIEPSIENFDPDFFNLSDNTNISGFFQNVKYFEKFNKQICKELTLKDSIQLEAKKILDNYRSQYPGFEFVSLHIRRGDTITVNVDYGKRMFGKDPAKLETDSVWCQYFLNAKDIFADRDVKFLIFTGGNRDNKDVSDLEWVNTNFPGKNYILATTEDPLLDFSLISQCDHNILSHVTSFGWWASYINTNQNKIMVAPQDYFTDNSNPSRLMTNEFILI
jgi:hypothetical protein